MLRKKLAAFAAMTVLAAGALTGCGAAAGDDEVVVGYSGYTLANPFFAGLVKGLELGAEEHGYKLVTTNSNGDNNAQVSDVQNLISQGVDYIVICPGDGKAIASAVKQASNAGIPVIAIADYIDSDLVTQTITADHVEVGALSAEQLVKFLEEKNGAPEGKIVNIQGLAGVPATNYREEGLQSVISEYPGIEVVATADGGFDTDKAFQVMSTILQAHSDIDAVFTANDAEAAGVTKALEAAGLFVPVGEDGHIFVTGNDAPSATIADIRANRQDVSVSMQPITMSMTAMDEIAKLIDGQEIEELIISPIMVITPANIDSPEVQEFGIWADQITE